MARTTDADLIGNILSGSSPEPESEAAETVDVAPVVDEIADEEVVSPVEGNDDELISALQDEDEPTDDVDDVDDAEEVAEESDEEEELSADAEEETEEVADDYLDVSDDDLIEVKIDGKVVYRPLRELKEALSADGAIQGRLKEATEERKAAIAERAAGTLELEEKRQRLVQAVGQLQEQLFPPLVGPPDEALRATNPQEYLLQESNFRADQQRIAQNKNQLALNLQEQERQRQETLAQWRQEQVAELNKRVPAFANPETAKAATDDLVRVASHYGVSAKELAELGDHRLFHMAHDVGKYLTLLERAKVTNPEEVVAKAKKVRTPRRLRSGVAQRNAKARQRDKSQQKVVDRARNSGRVEDIAATLMRPG